MIILVSYSGNPDKRTDNRQSPYSGFVAWDTRAHTSNKCHPPSASENIIAVSAAATAAAVHAVSLKLLTFLASRLDVWFQQTEAQFALRNIADSTTKNFYLLTSLHLVVAERMAGDVAAVPTERKYEYLKSKLMASQTTRNRQAS